MKLRSTITGLTALEVVERATSMKLQMRYFDDLDNGQYKIAGRGFNEETMKDFNIPALKMLGIDVINANGEYIRDLTTAKSVFITDINGDTLAYVPDEVIKAARPLIEAAYADEKLHRSLSPFRRSVHIPTTYRIEYLKELFLASQAGLFMRNYFR